MNGQVLTPEEIKEVMGEAMEDAFAYEPEACDGDEIL